MKFLQHKLLLFFVIGFHLVAHGMEEGAKDDAVLAGITKINTLRKPVKTFVRGYIELRKAHIGIGVLPPELIQLICEYVRPAKRCANALQGLVNKLGKDDAIKGDVIKAVSQYKKQLNLLSKRMLSQSVWVCYIWLSAGTGSFWSVTSLSGESIISRSLSEMVKVRNTITGVYRATFNDHIGPVLSFKIPEDKSFVSGSTGTPIKVYEKTSLQSLLEDK